MNDCMVCGALRPVGKVIVYNGNKSVGVVCSKHTLKETILFYKPGKSRFYVTIEVNDEDNDWLPLEVEADDTFSPEE